MKNKKTKTGILKVLQHILITAAAVIVVLYFAGTIVVVNDKKDSQIYNLSSSDQGRAYEDSVFFNTIFGRKTEDVLRYVTIRSQLETEGAYDPNKVIDVAAYSSRTLDTDAAPSVTASYYLGDLLKWEKYGFEYEYRDVSPRYVSGNFIDHTSFSDNPDGADPNVADLSDAGEFISREVLINRYRTVDGLTLEACVEDWSEYNYLVESLEICAQDLYSNYTEYLEYNDSMDELNTNMRYCVIMGEGPEQVIYSNIDIPVNNASGIDKLFSGYGRYISYDFDRMVYDTNTAITESTFNNLMQKYKYAYPDDCRIYIAADMTMPADDALRSAKAGFENTYIPADPGVVGGIVALLILGYLTLLVLCTILEGREYDENGVKSIRLTEFDHTPIELWAIITAVIFTLFILVPAAIASSYYDSFRYEAMNFINDLMVYVVFAVVVFIFDVLMLWLYYSLVRRIKARHIWKQSFLYKIISACGRGILSIYDNGNVLLRSVVPYVVFLLINLILVLMTASDILAPAAVLSLLIIDVLAGVFIFHQVKGRDEIISVMRRIISGDLSQGTDASKYHGDNRQLADSVNSIGASVRNAVEQSMKDERMKTDLVANVSHDIRTPLTSIINYVDLIKRENIEDPKIAEYIDVIDEKSQRLKSLTDDLIEVSKVSSGNVELELMQIDLPEMVTQALAEFDDKFAERNLSVVMSTDKLTIPAMMADGKSLWRVMENILGNVCKYAMPGTRVFVDMYNTETGESGSDIRLRLTNISEKPLPADLSELTERFIRGDESRTSEGSGLGLSIAKSLTELMGGTFNLYSENDLFKVEIAFKTV
ncbi:MAG: HAMP domain-containing histidine kinase [Lachnospiraceae bacterium]|nr:HAMP domain-containing histidine kinase [Lachnospiraceae bacterium]